jgi:hypothetical protein
MNTDNSNRNKHDITSYEDIYSILYGGSPYDEEHNESNKENDVLPKANIIKVRNQIYDQLNMLRNEKQKQNKILGVWNEQSLFDTGSVSDSITKTLVPCYHQGVYNLMYMSNCLNRENINHFRKTTDKYKIRFKRYKKGGFVFD